ncbi:MAG TPA: M17 family peptidase N-terminal domain-containing protein, partial [Alphaproteobacteria bacterium]|nr:M17 family peptidase N-terminal domain-containing protein [Alphaproteobacteria bacterium]
MLKVAFSPVATPDQNTAILTVASGQKLGDQGVRLDKKLGGAIYRAMEAGSFTGAKEQTLSIVAPAKSRLSRVILVGIGEPAKATEVMMQRVGGAALAALPNKETQATLIFDAHKGLGVSLAVAAANAGFGARLRSYRFDKYRTTLKPEQKPHLKSFTVSCAEAPKARTAYAALEKVADGVFFTRDLVSEPANIIYPETLA